ncbi:LacI family transcriptional regulator [Scandinavium sp. TWS1a]|uniref:LacI family DNA-binding transcriptional regulator n=1 Tax=Scandinavium tedordense TaxID=2926521 RepID=UPI001356F3FC|nr:LacI family DNA-binding transcriptional regulator [Scandinavium tedordense]MCS2172201.1 LacI family transcriptional regulator [Scandinavium tedordense]
MNIKELAKILDLSIATVSRALNSHPEVSVATQKRVLEAAKHYGYRPNAAGRNLRKGKVNTVALLLPPGERDNFYTATFFMRVAAGLQARLRRHDIDTILHLALDEEDEKLWLQRIIEQHKADAVILTNTLLHDPRIEYLHQSQFPFATLGRSATLNGAFNWVDLDFSNVASRAVEQGKQAGFRHIALVTLGQESSQGAIFTQSWREALVQNDLPVNEEYLFHGELSEVSGYEALRYFHSLPVPPDYIIFLSDIQMLGASFYARQQHCHYPFFAGVFSSDLSSFLPVKPTGFDIPFTSLGEALADAILNAMESGQPPINALPQLRLVTQREHKMD